MEYSSAEMLAIWRRRLHLGSSRADASVAEFEGIDTDALLLDRIRSWYLQLLDTAPPALLRVSETGRQCTLTMVGTTHALILPPSECRRVLSLKLQGWQRHVQPVTSDSAEGEKMLSRLASPYSRPGNGNPTAVLMTDGSITAAPVDIPIVESLRAVTDPGPDKYILCPALLQTIPLSDW